MLKSADYLLLVGLAAVIAVAAAAADVSPPVGTSRALIVAGLPGDEEHETLFATIAQEWRDWLTKRLDFAPDKVHVLFGKAGKKGLTREPANREALAAEVAALKKALRPEDRLWVFFLGHANFDGDHAYFHLPGPDVRADELGQWFAGVRCREQVFWMTNSAAGYFLRPLSAKGRIVIAATEADEEFNETEFPQALVTASKLPLEKLDDDKDGRVSLLELYRHVAVEVQARFAADERLPTEHAQLDDNGDGTGTEEPIEKDNKDKKKPTADGALAAKTFLAWKGPKTKP